jgi:hypothetical protein
VQSRIQPKLPHVHLLRVYRHQLARSLEHNKQLDEEQPTLKREVMFHSQVDRKATLARL